MTHLQNARVILTGASGGLGSHISQQLSIHQCKIGLVGRNKQRLEILSKRLQEQGADVIAIDADITLAEGRDKVFQQMQQHYQGVDILINNAAIMQFAEFV